MEKKRKSVGKSTLTKRKVTRKLYGIHALLLYRFIEFTIEEMMNL